MIDVDLDSFEEEKRRTESTSYFELEDGRNLIRLMPPNSDFEEQGVRAQDIPKFNRHYIERKGQDPLVFRCLQDKGEYCPACHARSQFHEHEDPNYAEQASDFKPSTRRLLNIVDVNNPQEGIQVLDAHYFIWVEGAGLQSLATDREWYKDIWDPFDGVNIVIKKEEGGKGSFDSFSSTPQRTTTDITEDLPSGWQDELDELENKIIGYEDLDRITKAIQSRDLPFKTESSATDEPAADRRPVTRPKEPSETANEEHSEADLSG